MKKILIILLCGFLLTSCSLKWGTENKNPVSEVKKDIDANKISPEELQKIKDEQTKRRKSFYGLIRKGDFYSLTNKKEEALKSYLEVYDKLGDDYLLEQKIAGAYFDLNQYDKAYDFYKKTLKSNSLSKENQEKLFLSLLYVGNNDTENEIKDLEKYDSIDKISINYYRTLYICYKNLDNCIQEFKKIPNFTKAKNLVDTRNSFGNSGNNDFQYRNALIAGRFLENKDYLAVIKLGEEILKTRPDYKSVLEIVGTSYYKLGKYKESNDVLLNYYNLDPKNTKIAYILGLTNFYIGNYIASNLYLNSAVLNGYIPKTELERRLIYNYYLIGDYSGMFKVFRHLLKESDVTEEDFKIALYSALEKDELPKASSWIKKGLEKFPDSGALEAFNVEIERMKSNLTQAEEMLNKALEKNEKNPILYYYAGNLFLDKNDFVTAKNYYNQVIDLDLEGVFGEKTIAKLEVLKEKEAQFTNSGVINSGTTDSFETSQSGNINQ
ncbi:MAG: hypothetical protein PHO80_05535 [Candidatus Gracilibacteria bacterium]|nr:hypothetical protein [Candidatus Gracilibacteria bacterium]